MNLLKFTRYSEWWEYKLVPLLVVGYSAIIINRFPIEKAALTLLVILLAIISGAIYVSVINDLTDIKEDAIAGKNNRMAGISPDRRLTILLISIIIGLFFGYKFYPDILSIYLFCSAYLVFSLYSLPPVRLKKRGIWGVFCDAMGAHLFPALLIITHLTFVLGGKLSYIFLITTGIWAFCYGLRGILWHQFHDRDNDIKSNTNTFASKIKPTDFRLPELIIFIIEIITLSIMIYHIFNLWLFLSLLIYFSLVLIRKFRFKYETALILSPVSAPYQLLMNDFYLVFFPLSLLLEMSLNNRYGWLVLCLHVLLFPQKITLVIKDFFYFIKQYN